MHQTPKLKSFLSRRAVVFLQTRCKVKNEDVVEAAVTGDNYIWMINKFIAY